MSTKAVIGVYDSLAKAEKAELRLEETHLPVGQMSLIAPKMEAGQVEGEITAHGVADAVADPGVRLDTEQVDEFERMLEEGKVLLIFHGDDEMVAKAYRALGNADHDELTVLEG